MSEFGHNAIKSMADYPGVQLPMTDLETMELALRRALSAEHDDRIQDLSVIKVLERIIDELTRIQIDRSKSTESP